MDKENITIRLSEASIVEYVCALEAVIADLKGQDLSPALELAHWRIDALRARLANAARRSSMVRDRRAGAIDAVAVLILQVLRELTQQKKWGGLYPLPAIFTGLQALELECAVETFHEALLQLERAKSIQLNVANDPKTIDRSIGLRRDDGAYLYYVIPRSPEAGERAR